MLSNLHPVENLIVGVCSILIFRISRKYYISNKTKQQETNEKFVINKIMVNNDKKNLVTLDQNELLSKLTPIKNNSIVSLWEGKKTINIYEKGVFEPVSNDEYLNIEFKRYLTETGKEKMITRIFIGDPDK